MTTPSAAVTDNAEQQVPASSRRQMKVLLAAILGFAIITLDATVVNVALPSMRNSLGGGISDLQWVVDGYTLTFAALLLSAGSLADRIGANRAFGAGLAIFVVASALCGLAPSVGVLILARFVQGCGAAAMMPSSMALIRHAYTDTSQRARAVGWWAMGGAVSTAAGPSVGGLLCLSSWRWIFVINLPIGLLAFLLLRSADRSPHHRVGFDSLGQITATIAMAGVTYGAIEVGPKGWASPSVIIAFAVAVLAAAAFLTVQSRVRHPMVPLSLFRTPNVGSAVAIGFAFMVSFYGAPFLYSLYFQQLRGLSPLATGAAFVPMAFVGLVVTPFSARIVDRIGPSNSIRAGLFFMIAGLLALAAVPAATTPLWVVSLLLMLVGVVGPLVMPPTMALLLDSVDALRVGTASAVFNTGRQIGGALAVAVFGALLTTADGFAYGMRLSLALAVIVGFGAVLASLRLRR